MDILGITFTLFQIVLNVLTWCVILPINLIIMIWLIRENNKYKFENLFPNSPLANEKRRKKKERKEKLLRLLGLKNE